MHDTKRKDKEMRKSQATKRKHPRLCECVCVKRRTENIKAHNMMEKTKQKSPQLVYGAKDQRQRAEKERHSLRLM